MADTEYLYDGIGVSEILSTEPKIVLQDSTNVIDVSGDTATRVLTEFVVTTESLTKNVVAIIADSIAVSDILSFLRNVLHLPKRIFSLRLRR